MLKGATKQDFIEIISKMSVFGTSAEQIILDWCKRNNEKNKRYLGMSGLGFWMGC